MGDICGASPEEKAARVAIPERIDPYARPGIGKAGHQHLLPWNQHLHDASGSGRLFTQVRAYSGLDHADGRRAQYDRMTLGPDNQIIKVGLVARTRLGSAYRVMRDHV